MRWCVLVLVGCGRIAFDPVGGAGDGGGGGGDDDAAAVGQGESCANAKPIGLAMPTFGSVAGAADDVAGLCGNGNEVVYKLNVTVNGMLQIRVLSTFDGTVIKAPSCPPSTSFNACASFSRGLAMTLPVSVAGDTYLI